MSIGALTLPSGAAAVTCGDVPTGGLATICVEGHFRILAISAANRPLTMKYGGTGHEWALYVTRDGRVYFVAFDAAGVNAAYSLPAAVNYSRWAHVAGCYSGSSCRVFVDGVDVTFASRISGGVVADTAQAAQLGGYIGQTSVGFVGRLGWCRVSDVCRYPGVPAGLASPPAVDAHTLAQWNMAEGAGATVDNAEGTAAYDGSISGATWSTTDGSNRARSQPIIGGGAFGGRIYAAAVIGAGSGVRRPGAAAR